MSALGLIFIGGGILTAWSGFDKVIVFDVLRSFVGAPSTSRTPTGATSTVTPPSSTPKSGFAKGGGAAGQGGGGGGGGSF